MNAIFTISSNDYFPQAVVLMDSLSKYGKLENCETYILISDKKSDGINYSLTGAHVFFLEEFGPLYIPDFRSFAFKYNILELNTALKPIFFSFLLQNHKKVLYFDSDILVLSSINLLFKTLDNFDLCLTPHQDAFYPEIVQQKELDFLGAGHFNMGFCGISSTPIGKEFAAAWGKRLLDFCYNDPRRSLYVDQKWVDGLFFQYYQKTCVFSDFGVNIGPWNFFERQVLKDSNGRFFVCRRDHKNKTESPIVFFHFSEAFSRKNTDDLLTKPTFSGIARYFDADLRALYDQYYEQLNYVRGLLPKGVEYGYSRFSNGRYISSFERRIYRLVLENDQEIALDKDPFNSDGRFYKFLKKKKLLTSDKFESSDNLNRANFSRQGFGKKAGVVNSLLKMMKKTIGINNYSLLIQYLRFICDYNNQSFLYKK
jgi:lipopolysaccharide biosynthesis glycosyltransferase